MDPHVNGIDEGEHSQSLREELEKMGGMIAEDPMMFTLLEEGEIENTLGYVHHSATLQQSHHHQTYTSEDFSESYRNETETENEVITEEEGEYQSPDSQLNSWKDLRLPLFNEETVKTTILRLEEDCKKLEAELDQLLQTSKTTLTWKPPEDNTTQDQITTLKYKATRLEAELEDIQNKNGALSVDLAPDVIRMATWRDLANSVSQLDEIVSFLEERIEHVGALIIEQNKINTEMEELQKSLEEQLKAPKTTKEKGKGRGKTAKKNPTTENNKLESLMAELKHLTLLLGKFIDSNYPIPVEQRPKKRGRIDKEKEKEEKEKENGDNVEYITLHEYLRDLLHLWATKEGEEQYLALNEHHHSKFTALLLKTCIVEVHPVDKKKIKVAI